jgi:hypothetical protein
MGESCANPCRHGPRSRDDLDLAFDLDRNVERKLGEPDGAAGVSAGFRSIEFENDIGKPVDDAWLLLKARGGVDNAEDTAPGRDAVEVPQRALQAAEDGKRREPCGDIALFHRELSTELAQWPSQRPVRVLRPMTRDKGAIAGKPHKVERQNNTRRRWQDQAEPRKPDSIFVIPQFALGLRAPWRELYAMGAGTNAASRALRMPGLNLALVVQL